MCIFIFSSACYLLVTLLVFGNTTSIHFLKNILFPPHNHLIVREKKIFTIFYPEKTFRDCLLNYGPCPPLRLQVRFKYSDTITTFFWHLHGGHNSIKISILEKFTHNWRIMKLSHKLFRRFRMIMYSKNKIVESTYINSKSLRSKSRVSQVSSDIYNENKIELRMKIFYFLFSSCGVATNYSSFDASDSIFECAVGSITEAGNVLKLVTEQVYCEKDKFRKEKGKTNIRNNEELINMKDQKNIQISGVIQFESPYMSSGMWILIDNWLSLGLSTSHECLRLSRHLYNLRKTIAHTVGLHGVVSGKRQLEKTNITQIVQKYETLEEEQIQNDTKTGVIYKFVYVVLLTRRYVEAMEGRIKVEIMKIPKWWRFLFKVNGLFSYSNKNENISTDALPITTVYINDGDIADVGSQKTIPKNKHILSPIDKVKQTGKMATEESVNFNEIKRQERVKEIDRLILENENLILALQCQREFLKRSLNPLYNYTQTELLSSDTTPDLDTRQFNFPSKSLVREYIEELILNGRLEKLNHTDLWVRDRMEYDEDDEIITDDIFARSSRTQILYENQPHVFTSYHGIEHCCNQKNPNDRRTGNSIWGGSWLLRQTLGKGGSLGEKIGEVIENAVYTRVCSSVMEMLAKCVAAMHGVNFLTYCDVRLFVENISYLPLKAKNLKVLDKDNYAQDAITEAIRKSSRKKYCKKKKNKKKESFCKYGYSMNPENPFIQRDAVVETLIAHCQISAPLLKLFPLSWQRAMIGNIITLMAAVISDFCDGFQFQILGHQLSLRFKPISEFDMIKNINVGHFNGDKRYVNLEEFEAVVKATAREISESLAFFDKWHERALGGDILRTQIGNVVARIMLTLVDEILSGAKMDLWSTQVGGPRLSAALEFRTTLDL